MKCSVVDLFCGIGGLTKGLELAGLDVVAGIDINSNCKYAYETNNEASFITEDVENIAADFLLKLYPSHDIKVLVGCAPCQPFSKYTKRYRKEGHQDNKWKLLYAFLRLIKEAKPEIISMENVPELQAEEVFFDFIRGLEQVGYYVSWRIAYCPDYGVPQKRKRLVLLASLLGKITLIPPIYTREKYRTVKDAIKHLPPIEGGAAHKEDLMHRSPKLSPLNIKRIQNSVPLGSWKDWPESLQLNCHKKSTGKGYRAVYGRMAWHEPSPTITTQFYGYGNGRFGHPNQDRAISLREGALLQSFPRDYQFIPNNSKNIPQRELGVHIGNAVPVELGKAIGISIRQHLERHQGKHYHA